MRRGGFFSSYVVLATVTLFSTAACEKSIPPPPATARPSSTSPAATTTQVPNLPVPPAQTSLESNLSFGSQASAHQLVEGFFQIEHDAWRWTAKRFVVNLAVPPGAKNSGATLRFNFALPDPVFKQYKTLGMSASAGTEQVPRRQFAKPGDHEFVGKIPAAALQDGKVSIVFELDKTYAPGGTDVRALGVVAKSIALAGE